MIERDLVGTEGNLIMKALSELFKKSFIEVFFKVPSLISFSICMRL